MRDYELVVLFHPDLELDLDKPQAKLEKIIKDLGGEITTTDNWGKRKLAYPVKKQEYAVYVYYELSLDPKKVGKLDTTLNITDEVIRHLVTQHEEVSEEDKKETKKDNK